MKIRRALTAAAAAAVIAPAAVLTAPAAAFATGAAGVETGSGTTASGTTGSAGTAATTGGGSEGAGESGGKGGTSDGAQRPGQAGDAGGTSQNGGGTASSGGAGKGGTGGSGGTGSAGSTGTGGSTAGNGGTTAGTGGTTAGAGGSAGTGGTDNGAATGGGSTSGDTGGQTCDFESDQLRVTVNGLPSQLVAGGSWTSFTMRLTNTTGKTLTEVQPYLYVSSAEDVDRPYWELDTEYRDRRTGEWKTFHDASPQDLFGSLPIGPHSVVTLTLRTRVVKDAKPGAGYVLAAGDFRNRDGSCGSAKEEWYDFTILPSAEADGQAGKPVSRAAVRP
ncbi:hypothetical protein GTY89_16950, partial [Streptomyces sp. SID5471]|uniref:hypothetical protein n=1 Tax=Streptomyces sp. SID5471 TaxID=2690298 RepID=UPI0002ACB96A|nr:hypothetical protein [Streptomyces sp. SID5471]